MSELLKGAWDLHFHTSPDVSPRKYTDLELAKEWEGAGMRGGVIKGHYSDTTGRAAVINALFPSLAVQGGLALNRQAGGINPDAVERMAQAGGRFLWFPTLDSLSYQKFHHREEPEMDLSRYISVCDEDGKLLPEVYDVLDLAAQYDLVVGTGHIGEREGMPLVREAFRRGVQNVVLTHAENPATRFSVEAQAECVKLGALVEHSFFTVFHGRVSWEEVIMQIKSVGPDHCILVTDFGQTNSPGSPEGLREFAAGLLERGITEDEIDKMLRVNPGALMGLPQTR